MQSLYRYDIMTEKSVLACALPAKGPGAGKERVMEKMEDDWESPALAPNFYLPSDLEAAYHDAITGVINSVYTPEQACDYLDEQMAVLGII